VCVFDEVLHNEAFPHFVTLGELLEIIVQLIHSLFNQLDMLVHLRKPFRTRELWKWHLQGLKHLMVFLQFRISSADLELDA
jgi:hypothetical protein